MKTDWLTAFDALYHVYFDGAFSNLAVNDSIASRPDCDAAFVRALVKGTLTRTVTLDHWIGSLAAKGIRKVRKRPATVLRMGLYALAYLGSVPDHAAVSQAVSLAKTVCSGESAFVNAVLRGFLRQKDRLLDYDLITDPVERISVEYSYPRELAGLLIRQYGRETAVRIMDEMNRPAALAVRTNLLKTDRRDLIGKLRERGFTAEADPDTTRGILVSGGGLIASDLYRQGFMTVQSVPSMRSIEALGPAPGTCVLDMCAAPGGKTVMMAEMMENRGRVTACDIHPHRLDLIRANAARSGISIIETKEMDGTVHDKTLDGTFDSVLCDVPCSGLGVIRSKPEIRLRFDPEESAELVPVQRKILQNGYRYLKPGGRLLYSTCTIDRRENEEIIDWFIKQEPGVRVVEKEISLPYNNKVGFYHCLLSKPIKSID